MTNPLDLIINIAAREEGATGVGELCKNASCRPGNKHKSKRIHTANAII